MSRISWNVASSSVSVSQVAPRGSEAVAGSFAPVAGGFMVGGAWATLYRLAYEQALAMTGPSRLQKMLEPCMN